MKYKDLCSECGDKEYPNQKRDMGAITVMSGICKGCGEEKGIIPARDWRYACMDNPTIEDWD